MKRDLLLGLALVAGFSAQAVTSPYQGSVATEGTYYLYQVETGTWLQANRTDINFWTTKATLNTEGIDVELRQAEGREGFQIYCDFTGKGSLNGSDEDRFLLDQGHRDIFYWIFEPVAVDGVSNAYKIMLKATPEGTPQESKVSADYYMGAADGQLSDNPTDFTWQLVSRQERIDKMVADAANGPVDATWLIPGNDRSRNDLRNDRWKHNVTNTQGGGVGLDGLQGYPVQEYWHWVTVNNSITLTDLPNGTYSFTVQAFYRDTEIGDPDYQQRVLDGTENLRARYFAGAASAAVMSIFAQGKAEQQDGYGYHDEVIGKWVPNSMDEAGRAMYAGAYINDYIQAAVTDGTLTVGYEKPDGAHRDWFITKRFFLRYDSTTPIAEDLSGLKDKLQGLITSAEELPQVPALTDAIAKASASLASAGSATALLAAISDLQAAVDGVKASQDVIENYFETQMFALEEGVDTSEADAVFNEATSRGQYEDALKRLRYARRVKLSDRHPDVFAGNVPAVGRFYLYNIGSGRFLSGGSDWGAHAALSLPGIEIELQDAGLNGAGQQKFYIETGLYNGDDRHYLNYRGYMDATIIDGFTFIPVEGKENVYNIVQGDYTDVHTAWDPFANTDERNNDEWTVGTECRNLDPNDPAAQWKLVTLADREALIETASLENPVDLTHRIKSPGFNQRENAPTVWTLTEAAVWDYGANHYDFVAESWNTASCDINQMLEDLPEGVYQVAVQGYYRNGKFEEQANSEEVSNAVLYAGNDTSDDMPLPNILTESGMAPGEGDNITSEDGIPYQYPNNCVQATSFFKLGLYKVYTVVEKVGTDAFPIGVMKEVQGAAEDWVVIDNFRLYYYGNQTTKDAVKDYLLGVDDIVIAPATRVEDNRIFNLQGIEVTNPTVPGIYIQNGKKFIVR